MAVVRPTSSVQQLPACSRESKAALLALYDATGGPSWAYAHGWSANASSDPCLDAWTGVTCDKGVVFALCVREPRVHARVFVGTCVRARSTS